MLTLLNETLAKTPLDPAVYKDLQSNIYEDVTKFFMPEAIVLLLVLVMLTFGIFTKTLATKARAVHITAFFGLAVAYLVATMLPSSDHAVFLDFGYLPDVVNQGAIGSMLASDGLSVFFRLFLLFTAILTVWMSVTAKEMADRSTTEFYILMLGSLVGMMLLAGANNMLMVYLAVEMMS
ncbi:MAG: hypothetical protein KDB07_02025, partial [Planctomycetes bacterium]|nr:hypothetical protein [Planctomycetota bacterium]